MAGFKTSRHVPALWLYVVSCFTFLSILMGVVAIAMGAASMASSGDNEDRILANERRMDEISAAGFGLSAQATLASGSGADSEGESKPMPGPQFNTSRGPRSGRREFNFAVVVHGTDTDTFWYSVQQGVADAAELFGAHFFYDNPEHETGQAAHEMMEEDISKARRSLRDGLAVAIPNEEALRAVIQRAAEEIPVLSINSGEDASERLGAFTHIGMPDFEAGRQAGELMRSLGVQEGVCILHEIFPALQARCDGFRAGLNNTVTLVTAVPALDAVSIRDGLQNTLSDNGNANGVLALGTSGFDPAREELGGRVCPSGSSPSDSDCVVFGTFDVSPGVLDAIVNGEVNFGIDQQEYLQGYFAIAFLFWKARFGAEPGSGGIMMTGPKFVDTAEEAQALLSRNYTTMESLTGKAAHDLDIRYVVDGKPEDKFWDLVKRGVKYAANLYGVPVDYNEPENSFTDDEVVNFMRDEIQRAIDDEVDGLVVTIPGDNSVLRALVREAMGNGIPVVSIASGVDLFEDWGIPLHVGMREEFAGRQVGKRLGEAGATNVICLLHNNPDTALSERCNGLLAGLQEVNPEAQIVRLDSRDGPGAGSNRFQDGQDGLSTRMRDAINETIENDDTINAVVALGPPGSVPAVDAVKGRGAQCNGEKAIGVKPANGGCIAVATFDVEFPVFNFIEEESVLFAVDASPLMQGALPLIFLTLQNLWDNMPIGMFNSGPTLIDTDNVGVYEIFA
ncbi:unnamed protein product [Ostreobium quekettii]|uniref:Periplasmic binding protein domain-containing protein n=1 Tax=Ostreobium quekettii TaxID=121088 RepID=A0A8S1IMG4_9CHLO|nr:unnamed protein product [Ostreobium quekettii]|eukprot:evm.model.scf_1420.1 EVM.evm.TU.scf_1420.1   scf_1420:8461-19923(+)